MRRMIRTGALGIVLAILLSLFVPAVQASDVMPMEEMKELLNSVELHPQPSGYPELDAILAELLAPYENEDTFTKVKAMYDWCILNINFDWEPYTYPHTAPAYDRFGVDCELSYEFSGIAPALPYDSYNRSYYCLTEHKGVCYDYANLFAVMARYIGIDSYVHTGIFTFEEGYGTWGHHGWTLLDLNGELYVFDAQRDYRLCANGLDPIKYCYFGLTSTWRYSPEDAINKERDASFRSVNTKPTCIFISYGKQFCYITSIA